MPYAAELPEVCRKAGLRLYIVDAAPRMYIKSWLAGRSMSRGVEHISGGMHMCARELERLMERFELEAEETLLVAANARGDDGLLEPCRAARHRPDDELRRPRAAGGGPCAARPQG